MLAACTILALLVNILPADMRETLAGFLRRTIVAPVIRIQAQAERARNAFVERDITAARIDSLTLRNSQLVDLEHENENLRRLLGLAHEMRYGFVPAEALHTGARADENSILLMVGTRAGVAPRAAVVAPDGLVGIITSVDPSTSLAILWTHPEFRASAMAADGSAFGIVQPHGGDEPERYLLELRGVAFRGTLKPGTVIRSSGLGGVIPRGIPIGVVLAETKTSEDWARTYLVRPSVRPHDVTNVMVVLPGRASGDLTTVWPTPAVVDSAVRRIVAAGDSMAQSAARDSIRRELEHRDSVRRDSVRKDSVRRDTVRHDVPGLTKRPPQ
jgi:rod shape-determining protein MreC